MMPLHRTPPHRVRWLRASLLAGLFLAFGSYAAADAGMCDRAAEDAAARTGVPVWVLFAITRVETGRDQGQGRMPWPWATNVDGIGQWHPNRDAAERAIAAARRAGHRSIDIGCFQLNHRWHGQHFPSPAAMLSPRENADYAAAFLSRLYREFGDWDAAVAAYHSRTPVHAARYLDRFRSIADAMCRDDPSCGASQPARTAPAPTPSPTRPTRVHALPAAPRPALWSRARPLFGPDGSSDEGVRP